MNFVENFSNHSQVRWYATAAGFKQEGEDLAVVLFPEGAVTAAVFTQNHFVAAPVTVAKEHILCSAKIRALLINSGNANCGNGDAGMQVCRHSCELLAKEIACTAAEVLPFSTGVINEAIAVSPFARGVEGFLPQSGSDMAHLQQAAKAIMTTDTVPKVAMRTVEIAGECVEICGIAKGAGMIHPNMATMLSFVWTNVSVAEEDLQVALQQGVEQSFNCISVDGDTSTNDSCTLTATASSDLVLSRSSEHWAVWQDTLNEVLIELAQAIVRDGEGASKFVTIEVSGGASIEDCRKVGFTIAHSPLVKTAIYAEDPNLGRIAAAVGRAGVAMDFAKVKIWLDDFLVMENGQLSRDYDEPTAQKIMHKPEFCIKVDLAMGESSGVVWTTDLSHQYVSINADYRS